MKSVRSLVITVIVVTVFVFPLTACGDEDSSYGAGDLARDIAIDVGVDIVKDAVRQQQENAKTREIANAIVTRFGFRGEGFCSENLPQDDSLYPIEGRYISVVYSEEMLKKAEMMCVNEESLPFILQQESAIHVDGVDTGIKKKLIDIAFVLGSEQRAKEIKEFYNSQGFEAYYQIVPYVRKSRNAEWELLER